LVGDNPTGIIAVVPMARSKKLRAAFASRRVDMNMSMTCPNSSTAR
jgi:hypothetical protein